MASIRHLPMFSAVVSHDAGGTDCSNPRPTTGTNHPTSPSQPETSTWVASRPLPRQPAAAPGLQHAHSSYCCINHSSRVSAFIRPIILNCSIKCPRGGRSEANHHLRPVRGPRWTLPTHFAAKPRERECDRPLREVVAQHDLAAMRPRVVRLTQARRIRPSHTPPSSPRIVGIWWANRGKAGSAGRASFPTTISGIWVCPECTRSAAGRPARARPSPRT